MGLYVSTPSLQREAEFCQTGNSRAARPHSQQCGLSPSGGGGGAVWGRQRHPGPRGVPSGARPPGRQYMQGKEGGGETPGPPAVPSAPAAACSPAPGGRPRTRPRKQPRRPASLLPCLPGLRLPAAGPSLRPPARPGASRHRPPGPPRSSTPPPRPPRRTTGLAPRPPSGTAAVRARQAEAPGPGSGSRPLEGGGVRALRFGAPGPLPRRRGPRQESAILSCGAAEPAAALTSALRAGPLDPWFANSCRVSARRGEAGVTGLCYPGEVTEASGPREQGRSLWSGVSVLALQCDQ